MPKKDRYILEYEDFNVKYIPTDEEIREAVSRLFADEYSISYKIADNIISDLGIYGVVSQYYDDEIEDFLKDYCYKRAEELKETIKHEKWVINLGVEESI